METLFKFMFVRQPDTNKKRPAISLAQESDLQKDLKNVVPKDMAGAARKAAEKFAKSKEFLQTPDAISMSGELDALSETLDVLEMKEEVTADSVRAAIESTFGSTPQALVANNEFGKTMAALKDTLLSVKILPEVQDMDALALTDQLRGLELISKIAADDFDEPESQLAQIRRAPLQWPSDLKFDVSAEAELSQESFEKSLIEEDATNQKIIQSKIDRLYRFENAINELKSLGTEKFITTEQFRIDAIDVPDELEAESMMRRSVQRENQLFDLDLKRYVAYLSGKESDSQTTKPLPINFSNFNSVTPEVQAQIYNPRPSVSTLAPFEPTTIEETSFMLKPDVIEALSGETIGALKAKKVDLKAQPFGLALQKLEDEAKELNDDLEKLLEQKPIIRMRRVGQKLIVTKIPVQTESWGTQKISKTPRIELDGLAENARPQYRNKFVRCSGVADLLVVKQQLIRYEGADVAHIENVLLGEKKEREHTARRLTNVTVFSEAENSETQDNEYQSNSRFEMSSEANRTIKSDASRTAGVSISGKYGLSLEFKANLTSTSSRSRQNSTKAAESFSKDITERSATKISERAVERITSSTTNEMIDRNAHSVDNASNGVGHISGIYQWVNKVYRAQMFNYGARGIYEFMVPEPAAYFIHSLEKAKDAEIIEAPHALVAMGAINRNTYLKLARRHRALDIQPPPPRDTMTSFQHHVDAENYGSFSHSAGISIPPGYEVEAATVVVLGVARSNSMVDLTIGNKTARFFNIENLGEAAERRRNVLTWTTEFEDQFQGENLPITFVSSRTRNLTVTVKVKCKLSYTAYAEWKLDTYARLERAYQKQLEEYEDKVAALEAKAGIEISGRNPDANMQIMKEELKKHCIYTLTESAFGGNRPAMVKQNNGAPYIDLARNKHLGAFVRFFEQAFEWENMTWITYPYFWGNRDSWEERIHYEDNDPVFQDFLKAGYCRISVPARLEFMAAIDHYLITGQVWNGGDVPPVVSDLFIPIAEEIAERQNKPGSEIPQGDPWTVKVPTSLVQLRADNKLPAWIQNKDDEWVEKP